MLKCRCCGNGSAEILKEDLPHAEEGTVAVCSEEERGCRRWLKAENERLIANATAFPDR